MKSDELKKEYTKHLSALIRGRKDGAPQDTLDYLEYRFLLAQSEYCKCRMQELMAGVDL